MKIWRIRLDAWPTKMSRIHLQESVVLLAAIWGTILLCTAILDWVRYSQFIGWLPFR